MLQKDTIKKVGRTHIMIKYVQNHIPLLKTLIWLLISLRIKCKTFSITWNTVWDLALDSDVVAYHLTFCSLLPSQTGLFAIPWISTAKNILHFDIDITLLLNSGLSPSIFLCVTSLVMSLYDRTFQLLEILSYIFC